MMTMMSASARSRRHLTSWYSFVIVLAGLVIGILVAVTMLRNQVEQRAHNAAFDTASVVVALTVDRNVIQSDFGPMGALSTSEKSDLDGDVATLEAERRLVGLEIWRSDGHSLYIDPAHRADDPLLSRRDQARIVANASWMIGDTADRGVATWEVFVPYDAGADGVPDGLVKVVMPDAHIGKVVATTSKQLYALAIAVLVVGALGLTSLRRRLVRREYQACHDRLTGLLNWGGFRDAAKTLIDAQRSDMHGRAALLLIDLDGFKSVNDTLGHPAGDVLLQRVGETIQACVGHRDLVARMGGDEYAVLLTSADGPLAAEAAATQMLDRIQCASFEIEGIGIGIEASVGIAMITVEQADLNVLLSHADIAMYRAKRGGFGIAVYDDACDHHDLRDLTLLGELRRAIENNELTLEYQPKVSIVSGEVTGLEALVRWQHPTRGLLTPDTFVPLAESTGLLGPLTRWVLSSAIADAAHWLRGGLSVQVAVNISPRSLVSDGLTATIGALLRDNDLPAHLLEVEVTETAIMSDPDGSSNVLRQLRAMGIRTSIDDFGSGYTSLAYLRTLPVDALKIDRIFITDLMADDKGLAVTQSIIDLGHRLGLSVLAEGVETVDVWRQLGLLGCDEIQGYLLSPPMHAEHVEGWITAHTHQTANPVAFTR
jgi:diguanylate cyclase